MATERTVRSTTRKAKVVPPPFDYWFAGEDMIVAIYGKEYSLNKTVTIPLDPDGINQALAQQARQFGWWAVQAVDAEAEVTLCKNELKLVEASIDIEIRSGVEELVAKGGKKPTDVAIQNMVQADDRLFQAQERLAKAVTQHKILGAMVETWRQRAENLRSLSANVREESKQEAYIS